MAGRCGDSRRNLLARTVTALALVIAPAALGERAGPCPPQTGTVVQEVGERAPAACLLDDRGNVQALLYPPSQRHPAGRVGILANGSEVQIELGTGDLAPGLAPSFDRLRPDTLARIRARVNSAAPPVAPPDAGTGRPLAPSTPPRTPTGERILARHEYDWRGRVRTKIGDEGVRHYVYDGDSDRVVEELDENGIVVVSYVWGGERLVGITRSGQTRYPLYDGLGSVTGLTDEQGAVVASYHLDAWGAFRAPAELDADPNRYAFTGHRWEGEIGMYRAGARYFDPGFGRFLTQDPVLGQAQDPISLHRYLYANDNPARYTDPTGHASRVIETDPRRTGFTVTSKGYTQALTYETTVTVIDDQPAAYVLPQTVGRRVAPLNQAAETGVRVAGVALQATAAATLAAVPEPTGLTKAGAVYFGARALDEGQALARELATGTPTASFAHQGVSSLYEAAGDDARTASFKASLTLAGADLTVGFGAGVSAVRASGTTGAIEGTVVERPSQVPASGSTQLRVLSPHFTPDPTRVLQNITTAQNVELAANPASARGVLSLAEYKAGQSSVAVAKMNFGKAIERSVADEIKEFQPHSQLFKPVGGPNKPDFVGRGLAQGMNFDITTPGQVGAHLARPGYGPGLNVVTYQRPPLFRLFP